MTDRLLKVRDVCERTQLGRSKVYDLIATGELRAVRFGGKSLRVREPDLDELIRRGAGEGAPLRIASGG